MPVIGEDRFVPQLLKSQLFDQDGVVTPHGVPALQLVDRHVEVKDEYLGEPLPPIHKVRAAAHRAVDPAGDEDRPIADVQLRWVVQAIPKERRLCFDVMHDR